MNAWRAALAVAGKDLRLRLRDRSAYIMGFVAPLALAAIISFALPSEGAFTTQFALVDLDQSDISQTFRAVLESPAIKEIASTTAAKSEEEARTLIRDRGVRAAFVIPAGFAENVRLGGAAELEVIEDPGATVSADIARALAQGFVERINTNRLSVIAALPPGPPSPLAIQALAAEASQLSPPISVVEGTTEGKPLTTAGYFGPSMAIFFLFFVVQVGATSLLDERSRGTLARMQVSPAPPAAVLFGKLLAVVVMGMVSLSSLMLATAVIFGADVGNPLGVAALTLVTVLAAAGITAAVATLSRSQQQSDNIGGLLIMGLTLLGGNFIPISQAPVLIRKLSLLTPNGWALRGFTDLATTDAGVGDILPAIGAICAFAVVTLTVSALKARALVAR